MKVVAALDSFKGSLTSLQAGEAVRNGVLRAFPEAEVKVCPLADGGEGTVEALTLGMGGELVSVPVTGPVGETVDCVYGRLPDRKLAVIEMSAAAGLPMVPVEQRDPLVTTTFGVGEVIRHAVGSGCRSFLIGIGGSATNDGGAGMLQALGFGLLDEHGNQIPRGAVGLRDLKRITVDHVLPELKDCSFRIACDVNNPLCGETGASAVYGPQKGATSESVEWMDQWLWNFAALAKTVFPAADPDEPGSGAAGGLGFAFRTFLNGTLRSGIEIVLEETGLEDAIRQADVVVTGEGRLDAQTVMGKAPSGAAKLAKKYGRLVIAFSGAVAESASACNRGGIDAFFTILRSVVSISEAMDPHNAAENLAATAEQAFRLLKAGGFHGAE